MVPSDLHFIIRHVLTGTMFLIFIMFGIWNVELWARSDCHMIATLHLDLADECTIAKITSKAKDIEWLVLVLAIIIGITLQGTQMAYRYLTDDFFTDEARKNIAKRITEVIMYENVDGLKGLDLINYRERFLEIACRYPDALYVWVYHSDAEDKLVEWARRRRSYHYLGLHLFTAFLAGAPIGVVVGFMVNLPFTIKFPATQLETIIQAVLQVILLAISIMWACGAYYLSRPMKAEADSMELAWSCGRLYPGFKRRVLRDDLPASTSSPTTDRNNL